MGQVRNYCQLRVTKRNGRIILVCTGCLKIIAQSAVTTCLRGSGNDYGIPVIKVFFIYVHLYVHVQGLL